MIEVFIGLFLAVFCISGAVSLIKWIVLKITASENDGKCMYAVLLEGEHADIRLQMAIETLNWSTALKNTVAVAVDCGLKTEMAEYCQELCKNSEIRFVKAEDFGLGMF